VSEAVDQEVAAQFGMDEEERALAEDFYDAMMAMSAGSERSQQSAEFRVGVSDLGFCSERTRRMLDQQVPNEHDYLLAWIGTALGDHAEQAYLARHPECIRQAEVTVSLTGDQHTYVLTGHPDILDPNNHRVIDVKTDYGLTTIERTGPTDQMKYQRNLYAKGAWEAGLLGDCALEDVQVANVWIDRSGIEKRLHVQMEPFDPMLVDEAARWLDDVVYAFKQGEEARKEPPREMCAVVCGFFDVCRAYDTDVQGLITDSTVLSAVDMYREGLDLEKRAKKLKDEAKQHLVGISGSTGEHLIRWTHINETFIEASVRRGYDKIMVTPIKRKAGK